MTEFVYPRMLKEGEGLLEHLCELRLEESSKHRRLTGLVCTIGRESQNVDKLEKMVMAGMNIVRINFSHDSQEFHSKTFDMVREACKRCSRKLGYNVTVAIAIDIKGPEIRTGGMDNDAEFQIRPTEMIRLTIDKEIIDKGSREMVYIDYANLIKVAQVGNRVYINDGAIIVVVQQIAKDCLICQVEVGAMLGSYKSVRLPEMNVDLPIISEKDRQDIKFGLQHNIDMIFVSGVRNETHIKELRNLLGEKNRDVKLIAKVEYAEAIERLDEILKVSDGILFARGDLVMQIPIEQIFLAQKSIIARCNRAGKPIICATQILESMRYNARPTRAEVNDLGNIILDGADCVMLSSESSIGRYPVEAVQMMSNIVREAESALWYGNLTKGLLKRNPLAIDAAHSIAIEAVLAAKKALATAIVVLTMTGKSAAAISKYRPRCPIFAVTRCPKFAKQMHLYRGVIPVTYTSAPSEDWVENLESRVHFGLLTAKMMKVVRVGDAVIIVSAWKDGAGFTNNLRLVYAFFERNPVDCLCEEDRKVSDRLFYSIP